MFCHIYNSKKIVNYFAFNISRYKSEKKIKSAKTEKIHSLNYETKSLFGAVTNEKNQFSSNVKNSIENDKSSEIFWLTQYVKPVKTPRKKIYLKSNKMKSMNKLVLDSKSSSPIFVAKEENKLIKPEKVSIPFTSNQLNEMLNFPLIYKDSKKYNESLNTDEVKLFPSVTKILQATMSEFSRKSLQQWKIRKIEELGENGFLELQKSYLQQGKEFHEILDNYFKTGNIPESTSSNIKTWESVYIVLKKIEPDVKLIETSLVHPGLKYKGVVDCVSTIDSNLHVIEWKKSDRPKPTINSTYDAPIQVCAYLGALNADPRYTNLNVNKGIVVVAYTNGQCADYYKLNKNDLNNYWKIWLNRLQEYWIRLRDGTIPEPI